VHVAHIRISFGVSWYSASCLVIFCWAHPDDIAAPINQAARPVNVVWSNPRRGIRIGESNTVFSLALGASGFDIYGLERHIGARPSNNVTFARAVSQPAAAV
jgi:hypothetical protein